MGIEKDIEFGTVFGEKEPVQEQSKVVKVIPRAKTMQEATENLKSLDAKKKKSKSGAFVKGTHGSGSAKMRADYKDKKRARSSQKKK
jgi:hypothetical protein